MPGEGGGEFPTTRGSAILGIRSGEPALRERSLETLVAAYWRPVYKYVRVRWGRSREEAEDLTQGFFLRAMEKSFFEAYDPEKSRFRTFLRTCVDGDLANEQRAGRREKRGGGAVPLPLDFPGAEREISGIPSPASDSPEDFFQAEWVRGLFALALESLRSECEAKGKGTHFRLFERYDLEEPGGGRLTYEDLAAEFHLPVTAVTNHLAFVRREFRRTLLEKLREITATEEEFRREALILLGEGELTLLDDRLLEHLRKIADLPDLSGTRYRARKRLGRGGMGTVYLVEDTEMGREVALKVLSVPDPGGDLSARLLAEARLLALLEHPNIVPVHDLGTLADGSIFYVMKYVRGKRLDEWRREGPARPEILRLFLKVCEAVGFAHAQGVIHRDLKPENVMVGAFGEALVMDWGVAKILGSRLEDHPTRGGGAAMPAAGTAHGSVLGTPAYMAPEQARGETDRIDGRADVYALGAILHYLLAGRPPISAGNREEAVRQAAEGSSRPLRRIDPGISRDLEAICLRAMAFAPEARYPEVAALSADIRRTLDGLPVAARPVSLPEKALRFLGRNRVLVSLVAAYLLMRILVLFFTGR